MDTNMNKMLFWCSRISKNDWEVVLVCLGCYNKNTIAEVAYKQQTFISNSFGDWEVWNHGAGRFGVWWEPASSYTAVFSLCPRVAERSWELWGISFIKAQIPLMRDPLSRPEHLPKALCPISSQWALDINMWIWRGKHIQFVAEG